MKNFFIFILISGIFFCACGPKENVTTEAEDAGVIVPVTVAHVDTATISDYAELNATSAFLQTSIIKASANAYIHAINITQGAIVHAGTTAFVLKTKESKALGNTITKLDSSFHFSGLIPVVLPFEGYVQELNRHQGDYVQEGEQLAIVADLKSFGFILNVPYEYHSVIKKGNEINLVLPGNEIISGTIDSYLPGLDSASQTQGVFIKIRNNNFIPQNLVAKARITKAVHRNILTVPEKALLTNESQTEFWIMKMTDSTTAVKVNVVKGLAVNGRIEITGTAVKADDVVLVSGNYGLADTAKVKILTHN